MPLSFESLSHGTIAFGFFNIESDMLLLDRYFFYASDFCDRVGNLAIQKGTDRSESVSWDIMQIDRPADIGDLMGAIHGVRFSGFIGDVYRRFPFPQNPADFKQKSAGVSTQSEMNSLIKPYARLSPVRVTPEPDGSKIILGDYHFDRRGFQRLLDYVWLGGYPRWKGDIRPDYVVSMRKQVLTSSEPLFKGMRFTP